MSAWVWSVLRQYLSAVRERWRVRACADVAALRWSATGIVTALAAVLVLFERGGAVQLYASFFLGILLGLVLIAYALLLAWRVLHPGASEWLVLACAAAPVLVMYGTVVVAHWWLLPTLPFLLLLLAFVCHTFLLGMVQARVLGIRNPLLSAVLVFATGFGIAAPVMLLGGLVFYMVLSFKWSDPAYVQPHGVAFMIAGGIGILLRVVLHVWVWLRARKIMRSPTQSPPPDGSTATSPATVAA